MKENPMRHVPLPATLALSLALAAGLAGSPAAFAQEAPLRQITITGDGMVATVPDMAVIDLGVQHEAETAAEALALMSAGMTAVLDLLKAAGIAETDIQTGSLRIDQRWEQASYEETPKLTGYYAATTVTVRVRDLAMLGGVLDQVVSGGVNQMAGLRFDLSEPGPVLQEARRDAVADARAKAELYAEAAGFSLGPVLALSEQGSYGPPSPMFDMVRSEMAMPVPVAAGEVNMSAQVTITWQILD
jgi:uncharacterized protein YggE